MFFKKFTKRKHIPLTFFSENQCRLKFTLILIFLILKDFCLTFFMNLVEIPIKFFSIKVYFEQ